MSYSSKPTLLVIDDEEQICELLGAILSTHFEVRCCSYSWELLDAIGPDSVDAILTDFYMPGTQGMSLVKAIKSRYPNVPVAIMTGASWNQREEDEAISAGACMVAYKPFGDIHKFAKSLSNLASSKKKAG